ncbi:nuclease-related domain-containing protein [Rathayibacter sp. YIM 133350]|uniref:nuclease-related domain-containing protein n=1 Tax=Rathayibacter sp. YIM 133350 TaxID=3131992 RepID=UPI00307DB886
MTATHETPTSTPAAPTLLGRRAASAVVIRALAEQSWAAQRSPLARVLGLNPLAKDARSWYAGALGELRIGARLEHLGPEWTVLHSVPVGRGESDIDHIVIGPTGVFTLNTKHHDDAKIWIGERSLMVNGQKTQYLRNARSERDGAAKRLAEALGAEVPVYSAIVIVGAKEWTFRQQPEGVAVLRESELLRWLRKRRPTSIDAPAVAAAAARPGTWHERGVDVLVEADPHAFAELRAQVNRAAAVRGFWMLAILAGAVWGAVSMIVPSLGG